MDSLQGQLLISSGGLFDPNFRRSPWQVTGILLAAAPGGGQ